jgi:hypothetical protein
MCQSTWHTQIGRSILARHLSLSNTTKLIPAWFTSTRGVYLNHIQKLPISSSQIVGSVIFMGNHHQDHLDLKYSCVDITSLKGWNPVRQLMPSTQLCHLAVSEIRKLIKLRCWVGQLVVNKLYYLENIPWTVLLMCQSAWPTQIGQAMLTQRLSLSDTTKLIVAWSTPTRGVYLKRLAEELPNSSSQILGSVIFMDNHHLKLILHRTIYVVWLTKR